MTNKPATSLRSAVMAALALWALVTLSAAGQVLVLLRADRALLDRLLFPGPLSDYHVALLSVAVTWGVLGLALAAVRSGRVRGTDALALGSACLIVLLYVNVLRERPAYGDFRDYVAAAASLRHDQHLPPRYLYPPLWAMGVGLLLPFGWRAMFDAAWLLNIASLAGFSLLLPRVFARYGVSEVAAITGSTMLLVVNVPVLRTLGYLQINLHVMLFVLASLALYPSNRAASAIALALATHLKMSPALVAVGFLIARDWRWLAWFVGGVVTIFGATVALEGIGPYVDLLANLQGIYAANPLSYREYSIDSLFRSTMTLVGRESAGGLAALVLACKIAICCWCAILVRRWVRASSTNPADTAVPLLVAPVLLTLMLLLSPLVWEHHGVFVALPFLVLATRLSTPAEGVLFAAAYAGVFLIPTIDFYPWSYGRLAAVLCWLVLASRISNPGLPSSAWCRLDRIVNLHSSMPDLVSDSERPTQAAPSL